MLCVLGGWFLFVLCNSCVGDLCMYFLSVFTMFCEFHVFVVVGCLVHVFMGRYVWSCVFFVGFVCVACVLHVFVFGGVCTVRELRLACVCFLCGVLVFLCFCVLLCMI